MMRHSVLTVALLIALLCATGAQAPPSPAVAPVTTVPATTVPPPPAARPGPTTIKPASAPLPRNGFTNSLGMRFVPVPDTDVMFCIHETRRQDYAVYAGEVPGVDDSWKNFQRHGVPCGHQNNHPVIAVCWNDAQAFCAWISQKEGRTYRLPTDHEWSVAVGIARQEQGAKDPTPEGRSNLDILEYPWGGDFPPRTRDKAGNYGDTALHAVDRDDPYLKDYTDGFGSTAPVMSFKPNKFGLYDLGGNAWEFVEDWFNAEQKERTLRGASFYNAEGRALRSSGRSHRTPGFRDFNKGFRCVVEIPK